MTTPDYQLIYRQARYLVQPEGWGKPWCHSLPLIIGQRTSWLDEMLLFYEERTWAFLTAWNPTTGELSLEKNRQRNQCLLELIQEHPFFHAIGSDQQELYFEEHYLVLGLTKEESLQLSLHFNQRAFLYGAYEQPTLLVFCA